MRRYRVNEIFYSVQGEGWRFGAADVFVRFAGCNVTCDFCDTEFVSSVEMTAAEIVQRSLELGPRAKSVLFTGGEPLLQLDDALVREFKRLDWFVALETNGTRDAPRDVDYVACSPKVAEHAIALTRADELRYARKYGQAIPRPRLRADHLYLSPVFEGDVIDRQALAWCVQLVKENPQWRLSVQQHKLLRLA